MRRWIAGNWLILLPVVPILVTALVPRTMQGRVGVAVFAVCLPLLVVQVARWHRRDRQAERFHRGQCLRCGYSLTANISGVCPGCGTPARKVG